MKKFIKILIILFFILLLLNCNQHEYSITPPRTIDPLQSVLNQFSTKNEQVLGNIAIMHAGSDHVEAELESIVKVYRKNAKFKNTLREIDNKTIMIFNNVVASVILSVKNPIVAEKESEIPKLGRVILRKKGRVIAAAIVEDILDAEE